MIEKLFSIIEKEDKKNPLTDENIAKSLGTSREKINELRQEADIPSYLDRREDFLVKAIDKLLSIDKNISYRRLGIELNKIGFKISTFGLNKYKTHIDLVKDQNSSQNTKQSCRLNNHINRKRTNIEQEGFMNIIGNDGSLSQVIKLAKAAVLYPPNGLHTLIVGSTGVGKSQLVEHMHIFAKIVRNEKLPLIIFNCADYSDNPQLLVSQLFGHIKGSFTGADSDKVGLVEKANGGMLFLDEIHRLTPKGQEILFRIIDKGEFNRLGETNNTRKVNLMIIGATTENIESSLLNTFRRRIPVLIEIPTLEERPVMERMRLIKKFLKMEAQRINKDLYISGEIIKSLLFYNCPGNIGQLRSDIQVTCARAFLNFLSLNEPKIKIIMNDLPEHLKGQLIDISQKNLDFNMVDITDIVVSSKNNETVEHAESNVFKYNIYQFIEKRMEELKKNNTSLKEIKKKLSKELEEKIGSYTIDITNRYSGISKKLLQNIVGEEVINIVDDIKKILLSEIGSSYFSIFNVLCLHISSAIERLRMGKEIINPKLEDIKKNYKKEFKIALKITNIMKMKLGLNFSEDEAGFIALYLNNFYDKDSNVDKSRVGIIIITHGEVAKSMLDVATSVLGINHGVAITMALDEKPEEVYKELKNIVEKTNEGKGILILVDMGSLITFGDMITEEIGIPTKTVSRVDTLMVLEVIRKSVQSTATLESVFNSVIELERLLPGVRNLNEVNGNMKGKAIVTTCITGKGSAMKIKELLENKLEKYSCNIEIISIGLIDTEGDIVKKIEDLQFRKDIIAVIGTVNLKLQSIPFIAFDEIIQDEKLDLLVNSMMQKNSITLKENFILKLDSLFHTRLVRIFHSIGSREEIINIMARIMEKEGYVKSEFYEDILEREDWGSSFIGRGVAVPHTSQSNNIIKPCIGIAIIKNSIRWDDVGAEVQVVFMLALGTEHKQLFLDLYNLIEATDLIEKIRILDDESLIVNTVISYYDRSSHIIGKLNS